MVLPKILVLTRRRAAASQLASESATFTHAYCNHAVCAPSRDSFMTGLRPGTLKLWTFKSDFRHAAAAGPSSRSSPSCPVQRAPLTPRVNPGSLYRYGTNNLRAACALRLEERA